MGTQSIYHIVIQNSPEFYKNLWVEIQKHVLSSHVHLVTITKLRQSQLSGSVKELKEFRTSLKSIKKCQWLS